jgi:hypothetical protein
MFGETARVWIQTRNDAGYDYATLRYRVGLLDDGKSERFVEVVNGERLRRKGVGGSWIEAVESARTTTATSHWEW